MRDVFAPVRSFMNSQAQRPRRSQDLIADFSLGYAKGWAFKLGRSARSALSIELADLIRVDRRIEDGKEIKVSIPYRAWVQGCTFNFSAGTLIHQGNGEPRGTICSVQILNSTSSGRVLEDNVWSYDPGLVVFELYKPVNSRFENVGTFECTQLQLINLLRHGIDYFHDLGIEELEEQYESCVV